MRYLRKSTILNPPVNSLSVDVLLSLKESFDEALQRDDVKAIVVTGEESNERGCRNVSSCMKSQCSGTRRLFSGTRTLTRGSCRLCNALRLLLHQKEHKEIEQQWRLDLFSPLHRYQIIAVLMVRRCHGETLEVESNEAAVMVAALMVKRAWIFDARSKFLQTCKRSSLFPKENNNINLGINPMFDATAYW